MLPGYEDQRIFSRYHFSSIQIKIQFMSKFDEQMDNYREAMGDMEYDESLLEIIAKDLGPSIYNADSSQVACSDKTERDRIKTNFLIGKHGMADSAELDDAILFICDKMKGATKKYRPVFYYWLVLHLGIETNYN
jgi:hypothetical protein